MHTYPVQLNPAANEELIDVLKSNPALLQQVREADGGIVNRFPPTGLVAVPRYAGPSNGRILQPPNYRKRFNVCTEGCFCPCVPLDVQGPKAQKTGPSPDSESDGSDEDAPH